MKPFAFRLQAVLEQRRLVEERRREDLIRLRTVASGIREEIRALDEEMRRTCRERQDLVVQGDLARARLAEDYRHALTVRRRDHERRLADLGEEILAARHALLSARREHKAVETLRDRDLTAYQVEVRRQEQRDIDEIAARRHG
ncbi:MAG: flagellar export protein FliJ [Nitrospirota bacterium]|jgi:flagellar export protein FliJ